MKALLCEGWNGYQGLVFGETPAPILPSGCVRIAVAYATVGFGQLLVVAGKYQRKPPLPFVPGTEVAGVILEVASDVTGFKPGDRVAASLDWGGYGEQAIATAETVWHVPDGVELRDAAIIPTTYGTAYAALHWRGHLRPGQTLLILGAAGGVGLPAVELGKLAGARVLAVGSSPERLALARARGADEVLLHTEPELGQRVKALTDGRGVDLVFDPVGGDLFTETLRCTATMGRILIIGFASGTIPQIPANILLVKNIDVIGFNFGTYLGWSPVDERKLHAAGLRTMMQTLFEHVLNGEIKPTSSDCYALPDFLSAFEAVKSRRSFGRVLIEVNGG
ncbi:NADPH:quinone oxidoreductase family protein [Ottowia thiooxydans]|uniref:NADPH:quinone oxidoreductase family protein n=1 Tax=Ottowia thiooxydans TaxID=219182 RepID=UPI00040D67D5|nr:NADPH:quinone oxidoreductase family protein [Ottowia thiooxydans]